MSNEQGSESTVSRNQSIKEEQMAEDKEAPKRLSRRDFVKGAAAVAGAGALAGCAPAATPAPDCPPAGECAPCPTPWLPEKWDEEAEVVIVGFGDAGATAAIEAHDAGADVLILEKCPKDKGAGGNSQVGGNMWSAYADVEGAVAYFKAMSEAWGGPKAMSVDDEMVRAWAEAMSVDNINGWLISLGAELADAGDPTGTDGTAEGPEFPGLPGSESARTFRFRKSHEAVPGERVYCPYDFVSGVVEQKQIRVLYEAPAKELIQDGVTKEILGVIAERDGKTINVKARKAVLLTCGGFEGNDVMKGNYLRGQCFPRGTAYNTGDGITMALKVGADLWHMNNHAGPNTIGLMPWIDQGYPDNQISIQVRTRGNNYIWIDRDGKRFQDEARTSLHGKGHDAIYYFDAVEARTCFPRVPLWVVFDDQLRSAGPVGSTAYNRSTGWAAYFHPDLHDWSDDNTKEIEMGWIVEGDTIEALAAKINVDPSVLKASIDKWNAACAANSDTDFGRPESKLGAIDQPPYYAMQAWPTMVNTQGGPKRNPQAQIVDPFNKPIGRLYSAGELGSIYAWGYQKGGNIGECFAFGRVAGRNAAEEEPWE